MKTPITAMALAFTLFASPSSAADFRVVDLGAPCADVTSREIALGSRVVPWEKIDGATAFAFEGTAFGEYALALYVCIHDALFTGNYFFPVESLEAAVARYERLYKQISESYGSPSLDNSPWKKPLDPRWVQSDPKKYMTSWDSSRTSVNVSIVSSYDSEPEGWRIFIVYSPSKISTNGN